MVEKNKEKYFSRSEILLVVIGVLGFTTVAFSYVFSFYGNVSGDINDWAKLGDFFGGVLNPFVAFLAFIAILMTLRYTRVALRLTEQSNKATIESLDKANQLNAKQSLLAEEQIKEVKLSSLFNHITRIDSEQSELFMKEYPELGGNNLNDLFFEGKFFKSDVELSSKFHWDRIQVLMNIGLIYASLLEYKKLLGKKDSFFMSMAMKYFRHIKIPHALFSEKKELIPEGMFQTIEILHDLYLKVEPEVGSNND
ncbi:hypothetical protein [Kangiella sp. M94]